MLQSNLLGHAWFGIGLKVRSMIQRLVGVFKLGLGLINLGGMTSVFLQMERSEPTTWEVTSARVQKHNLSTMLSKRADNDSFSSSVRIVTILTQFRIPIGIRRFLYALIHLVSPSKFAFRSASQFRFRSFPVSVPITFIFV